MEEQKEVTQETPVIPQPAKFTADVHLHLPGVVFQLEVKPVGRKVEDGYTKEELDEVIDALRTTVYSGEVKNLQLPLKDGSWIICGQEMIERSYITVDSFAIQF